MAASKKSGSGPEAADSGLAALLRSETEKVKAEREEYEKQFPAYVRKPVISRENAVATVHRIADIAGIDEMPSTQVEWVAEFVTSGQLSVEGGEIVYSLRKPLTTGKDETKSKFVISEITDSEMVNAGVNGFAVALMIAERRHSEVSQSDIRTIARMAIRLPEDFANKLPVRELMAIYGLYITFFLGR